jgi:SUMO ligase MMS21 Smc5/6 complex component
MKNPHYIKNCGHTFEKDVIVKILIKTKECPLCRCKAD